MGKTLLRPVQDLVFQNLFGRVGSEKITGHLLSLILGKEIQNITLDKNKRLLSGDIDAKLPRLDLRAEYNNGEDCIVEMQATEYEKMEERQLFYWALAYRGKLPKGVDYAVIKPTISILIANYDIEPFKNINKYHTVWNLREKEYREVVLTHNIELHILEIPKIKKTKVDLSKDELALWLSFLNNPNNEGVKNMVKGNSVLEQAMEDLKDLSDDPDFNVLVEARVMAIMDEVSFRNAAERRGLKSGMEKRNGKAEWKSGIEQRNETTE